MADTHLILLLVVHFCSDQPPRFTLEPQDAVLPTIRDGNPVGASIHCSHDSPDTTVTWFRNSTELNLDGTRILHDNGTLEFTFLIDNVDLSATGVHYYCVLSNAFGIVISRTAILQSTCKLTCCLCCLLCSNRIIIRISNNDYNFYQVLLYK